MLRILFTTLLIVLVSGCSDYNEKLNNSVSNNLVFKDKYNNCLSIFEFGNSVNNSYSIMGGIVDSSLCELKITYSTKQINVIEELNENINSFKDNNQICWLTSYMSSHLNNNFATFATPIDCKIHQEIQSVNQNVN